MWLISDREWPDIDLDLPSGDEREKVIQYVYERYGKRGAARRSQRDRGASGIHQRLAVDEPAPGGGNPLVDRGRQGGAEFRGLVMGEDDMFVAGIDGNLDAGIVGIASDVAVETVLPTAHLDDIPAVAAMLRRSAISLDDLLSMATAES